MQLQLASSLSYCRAELAKRDASHSSPACMQVTHQSLARSHVRAVECMISWKGLHTFLSSDGSLPEDHAIAPRAGIE